MSKYHYCTGPLDTYKIYLIPDRLFGVDIGCCCKEHDIIYAIDHQMFDVDKGFGEMSRVQADNYIRDCIQLQFVKAAKVKTGFVISWLYWAFCRAFGSFYWKKWSLRGVEKYI